MGFKITLQAPNLDNAKELIDSAIMAGGQEATTLVNNAAVDNAPRKYGTLKRSIHPEVNMSMGKFTGKVIQDVGVAKYGPYVNNGTGIYNGGSPWTITPSNKKALAFKVGGETIIRKKVTIKGQKGQHFMERALEENQGKIQEIMQNKVNQAIEAIGGK